MTCRELHIEVEQSLQQVASYRTRKYLAGEIDWVLNKMQKRMIQGRLRQRADGSGGFDLDQVSADMIRTLIVTGYDLVPYIDPGENRYKCFLPPDYGYLLSDWSYTTQICKRDPTTYKVIPASVADATLYLTALRQDYSAKGSPPYYQTLDINMPNKAIQIPQQFNYGNTYTGLKKVEDISSLTEWISLTGGWYWERLADFRYPGYYILLSDTPPGTSPSVIVDGVTYTEVATQTLSFTTNPGEGDYYDNRLTSPSKISGLNSTEFYKTSYYGPISELSQNILYVYNDGSFIVSGVGISYIRNPLPISLSLNSTSELPENFHQNLCDLAVEYLKGRLENQVGQQMVLADNERRVVL